MHRHGTDHTRYITEYVEKIVEVPIRSPNPDQYEIEDYARVGNNLVIKAKYESCADCSYEGHKIMVFLKVGELDIIKWRKIDPHFRGPNEKRARNEAPSPAARFPASEEGWLDAIEYAKRK